MTATVYLGLGANLGDRETSLRQALHLLAPKVRVIRASSIYETAPQGHSDQPDFLNLVCRARTDLAPKDLLALCKQIEEQLGRTENFRNSPRPIDIDILFYDKLTMDTPSLTIPHPRIPERAFVLEPLAEFSPRLRHPVTGLTARHMLRALEPQGVRIFNPPPALRSPAANDWIEIASTVQPEFVEPLVELFRGRAKAAVAVEEQVDSEDAWTNPHVVTSTTVRGYLPATVVGRRRLARIEWGVALLRMITPIPPLRVSETASTSWETALRGHFTLLHIGKHLVVRPEWEAYQPKQGETVLVLDPGAAFGTGHHPTTRLCLELLEDYINPGLRVLDVGTGSGILSIAAALLGAGSVVGVDPEPLAVRMARRNVRANALQRRVRILRGSVPLDSEAPFPVVVANLTFGIIQRLPDLGTTVERGGLLLLAGLLVEQAEAVKARFVGEGFSLVEERADGDWASLALTRG